MGFVVVLVALAAVSASTEAHVQTIPQRRGGLTYGEQVPVVVVSRDNSYTGRGGSLRGRAFRDNSYDATARRGGVFTRRDNSHLIGRVSPLVNQGGYDQTSLQGGFGRQGINSNNGRYDAARLVQDVYDNRRVRGGLRSASSAALLGRGRTLPAKVSLSQLGGCRNCRPGEECVRTGSGRSFCRAGSSRVGVPRVGSRVSSRGCPYFSPSEEVSHYNRCVLTGRGKRYAMFFRGGCQLVEFNTDDLACRPDGVSNFNIFFSLAECQLACRV